MRRIFLLSLVFSFILFKALPALACESCELQGAGKYAEIGRWSLGFTFEAQNWDEMPAREAHQLHHRGHHFHDKTHEEFYHFSLGRGIGERFDVSVEVPYVVRNSIEIDDHARLGQKEESQGLGDTNLLGIYKLFRGAKGHFGVLGGVKIPTGSTGVENSQGVLFESELQPGTGSWDLPFGIVYAWDLSSWSLKGNVLYVVKTEGRRDFEAGDLFSTSLFAQRRVTDTLSLGADFNFQHEARQREAGVRIADSGGDTLLAGPSMSFKAGPGVNFFGNFLLPVYQNLGGVHQELDFTWTAGARVSW